MEEDTIMDYINYGKIFMLAIEFQKKRVKIADESKTLVSTIMVHYKLLLFQNV